MTPEQVSLLIHFQLYLYEKGLITDFEWNLEKEAVKFLKRKRKEKP